jgi:thiol:disulfide interchange protein DsbD
MPNMEPVRGEQQRGAAVMRRAVALVLMLSLSLAPTVRAQGGPGEAPPAAEKLVRVTAPEVRVAPGGSATAIVHLTLQPGWHVNANPPALEYNIPTTVSLAAVAGISAGKARYPKGRAQKFEFDETPLLVYDGSADVLIPISAAADATPGERTLAGTVEFQACNDQVCLAPTKVPFTIHVVVGAGDTSDAGLRPPGPGEAYTMIEGDTVKQMMGDSVLSVSLLSSGPGAAGGTRGSGAARGKLEQALAKGGLGWFLALFAGGLLLNLTPCVFPMLGVTVSIFGARRKEPLPKVLTTAVLYVLGICVTYTALGVVAALTGGLFGSALQSIWVNVVLGGLMLVLSLGMFGLYEMQPPLWLMDKLGGAQATNFAGAFLSGLGVGIIAAPCVGPFVVAVLALIAQKGDVGFGVRTMFTLSLGLGFPYLLLATFSNLMQSLPRSGGWMVWVKHGFGTLMAALGLYYLSIGFAPDLATWVVPAALTLGGLWLGFLDHSAGSKGAFRMFTRVAGALALFMGVVMGAEMYMAGTRTLTFKPYDPAAVAASVAAGRPVMLDFSADWCAPCHELELNTLSNERVVAEAKRFDRYKVDLTKYDAPESEISRRRYGITGVPTIVFLGGDGNEIAAARVEGFMPPEPFLGQMRLGAAR